LRKRLHITLDHEIEVLEHQFARNKVETIYGSAQFIDRNTIEVCGEEDASWRFTADNYLLAAGTQPFRSDYIPFNDTCVFDRDGILELRGLPNSLIVKGLWSTGVFPLWHLFRARDFNNWYDRAVSAGTQYSL